MKPRIRKAEAIEDFSLESEVVARPEPCRPIPATQPKQAAAATEELLCTRGYDTIRLSRTEIILWNHPPK